MDSLLIDTDIVLDFLMDRKPFSDNAEEIFSFCERKKANGYITPITCSNVYYILRKQASHEKVINKLEMLLQIIDVLETGKDVVLTALKSDFKDFEDALQNYSAINQPHIKIILTRNLKDYQSSTLTVLEPKQYISLHQ